MKDKQTENDNIWEELKEKVKSLITKKDNNRLGKKSGIARNRKKKKDI